VVAAGSSYAPALDLAAVLLADAGRPVEALAVRRRATSFGWLPADTAALQALLRQDARTGRNDPCPCGSGRKYKQCCQREPKLTTAERRRLAVHQAVQHAVNGEGRDHLRSLAITAMTEAMSPADRPADVLRRLMLDPFIIDIAAFESGRVDEYLEERAFLDAQLTAVTACRRVGHVLIDA
jgi:SEC-C motif